MDAYSAVEVGLRRATLHGDSEALGHLASVRATDVQPDHTLVVGDVADELGVTRVVAFVGNRPFERLKVRMVHL